MTDFAITTPKLGKQEGVPTIYLSEAFVSEGSSDVYEDNGEYKHNKGRLFDFVDNNGFPIWMPTNIFAITAVDQGSKIFTIAGNHAGTIIASGNNLRVNGSTGNDTIYGIVTAANNGPNTDITVLGTIASAVVDGNIFAGRTAILRQHRHVRQANDLEFFHQYFPLSS